MSKWSSFKEQQLLTENWRKFLNEEPVEPAPAPDAEVGGMEAQLGKS